MKFGQNGLEMTQRIGRKDHVLVLIFMLEIVLKLELLPFGNSRLGKYIKHFPKLFQQF